MTLSSPEMLIAAGPRQEDRTSSAEALISPVDRIWDSAVPAAETRSSGTSAAGGRAAVILPVSGAAHFRVWTAAVRQSNIAAVVVRAGRAASAAVAVAEVAVAAGVVEDADRLYWRMPAEHVILRLQRRRENDSYRENI